MKKQIHFLLALLFMAQLNIRANNSEDQYYMIHIDVSCVEYLEDGALRVHFGYENEGNSTVKLKKNKSFVLFNGGKSKLYVTSSFDPGVYENAFYIDINPDDQVKWKVRLSNELEIITQADINSAPCQEPAQLNIIPGYNPPEGGKEYNSKIGAELTSLYNAWAFDPASFAGATDDIFRLDGTRVLIEVVAEPGQFLNMISSLSGVGFDALSSDPQLHKATGWIDISVLLQLNSYSSLHYARPVYPGVSNYLVSATGLTNSQGDFAQHSDFVRLGYDVDGSGVKIGVLSNSYNSLGIAHTDVLNGDLPGTENPNGYVQEVEVLKDIDPVFGTLSDEGRAMLQIIHDVAPGAELAFRTGFQGEQDMALGIRELADAGCDVIVDDISYVTEPFFRDGIISQAVNEVVAEGHTFFSSAGNFGSYAYSSVFTSASAPGTIVGEAHDFGGGDVLQAVSLEEGDYMLVLQWDDGSDATQLTTQTDLDIFLSNDKATALLGFNRENIGGFPIEVVPFSVEGDTVISNIVIARSAGPDVPVTFKYMLFRGGSLFTQLEHSQGNSTIVGHPNAEGTIAVGAVRYDKNPIYSPETYMVPEIMSFSSRGGTPVNGLVRAKPDITAPNGVNTTVDLGNGDWDGDGDAYPNFFGTSAASPHAAGAAALLLEAKQKFDPGSTLSPEDIRQLMKSTALDMDEEGEDLISGAGFLQAHKAAMTFASPSPYVESLILAEESGEPGSELSPVVFTVNGDFFTDSTQIYFRGEALDTGVVVQDENTISVSHPGFLGNPEISAYTPPISSSGTDGGFSESSYFSDPVRQTVIIVAEPATKTYGEVNPAFTSRAELISTQGDTMSLEDAVTAGLMLQLEADRLQEFAFQSPANTNSDAGEYLIQPRLEPALYVDDPLTELDQAIVEKYQLVYVNSSLLIEKLALKITPNDLSLSYGDVIPDGGISFNYSINDSLVDLADSLLVLSNVASEHGAALSNVVSLARGVALVNGIPVVRGVALVNGVTMLRGVALVNGVEVLVEISGSDTTVFVDGEAVTSGISLARGVALVNGLPFIPITNLVRGVALVNGEELGLENGYITALNGNPLTNAIPVSRGVALVNGEAVVNGHTIVAENGMTSIDGEAVDPDGVSILNGITLIRGVALVNTSFISRGVALVNGLEIPVENGIPFARGVALVNGVPMSRGVALVNNLEVEVLDGEILSVREDGVALADVSLTNGVGFVRGVALVNGSYLSRGVALVNGIGLVNEAGYSEDVVNLENMNLLSSRTALANGTTPSVRGVALVNGVEGLDGQALKTAAGTQLPDGTWVFPNVIVGPRGVALVNGIAYARGVALVNGSPLPNGNGVVNSSTVNENSNQGTILVFDATDLDAAQEDLKFDPISFITGTTVGQHWIVPGTFISNNFDISYGLGTLSIEPAEVQIVAEDQSKVYGKPDPDLSYQVDPLKGEDQWSGSLDREPGEDAGFYQITQGSLNAGVNYKEVFVPAQLEIRPAPLEISAIAESRVYDGSTQASVSLSDNRLEGDSLVITALAHFDDKNVGEVKEVTVLLQLEGPDAGNYSVNDTVNTQASISKASLILGIEAEDKVYDGNILAVAVASIDSGMISGDELQAVVETAAFVDSDAGLDKAVIASLSLSGADAFNYSYNLSASDSASIFQRPVVVQATDSYVIIRENDPLPIFSFDYLGWIEGDAGRNGYSVLRESDGSAYDPTSSESAGAYTIYPYYANPNYSYTVEPGFMYVNPYGPGTRAIRPVLNCVEFVSQGIYVAYFEYTNRNDVAVHIPEGPDNLLSGGGIDWEASDSVPGVFEPGGGQFSIFFDGTDLRWTVNSLDEDHKTSNVVSASEGSTKCKKGKRKSAFKEDHETMDELPQELELFPNPASQFLRLRMEGLENYKQILLHDIAGKPHLISTSLDANNFIEIDLSRLDAGSYFIRVILEDEVLIAPFIKQSY